MENWQLAIVLLLAVLVGALIPVLFQLASLMREAKHRLRTTGRRLDDALEEIRMTLTRINRVTSGLDGSEHEIAGLVDTFGELNQVLRNLTTTAKVASAAGAAIGPAIAAAVRALREGDGEDAAASPEAAVHDTQPWATPGGMG
jgi:hypothetical protein